MINKLLLKTFSIVILIVPVFTAQNIQAQHNCRHCPPPSKKIIRTSRSTIKPLKYNLFSRTELYFGMNKPSGEVSEAEFADFLSKIITKEFPEGLTVLNGFGQFKTADNTIIEEKSKILIIFYSAKIQKVINRKIEFIRTAYKNRFQQQSVLRVDILETLNLSF